MRDGKRLAKTKNNLSQSLTGIFRASASIGDAIAAVHRALASHPHDKLEIDYVTALESFFKIDPDNFGESLPLELKHLRQIDGVTKIKNNTIEDNYLTLAVKYIMANTERVENLIKLDRDATLYSFDGGGNDIRDLLLNLPAVDRQSITVLKLFAALHSYSDDIIRDFFNDNMHSSWTKAALVYPLLYYYANMPNEASIDKMLMHFVPKVGMYRTERMLMKFVLSPQEDWVGNLSLRCYIGLLSHPYDTLEYITSWLEIAIANRYHISATSISLYKQLATQFPNHRIAMSVAIATGSAMSAISIVNPDKDCFETTAAGQLALLAGMLNLDISGPPEIQPTPGLMTTLTRVRWSRYPEPADFEELNAYVQRFSMLTGAKLVNVIANGLFLFERRQPDEERLTLLRSIIVLQGVCDFIWMSPGGHALLKRDDISLGSDSGHIHSQVTSICLREAVTNDRTWIMRANWHAAELQSKGLTKAWAKYAREQFPIWVHPRYISGLDWFWLSHLEKNIGLAPFQGNPDFIYVLFIRLLEKFQRESVSLRISVEPVAKGNTLEAFAEWIATHFGKYSIAFTRLFLTAETILKLRLASNYTAALTTRVVLLERGVIKFGFLPGMLTEEDLAQEQESLTATLSRMSVGARQFEIPWATLKVDANARNRDTYSTYTAMQSALGDVSITSNTKRSNSYSYSNGASQDYESANKDWPLIYVIAGIVDTFLTHPSAGIESILSVRIRHDSFRREFSYALSEIQSKEMEGVRPSLIKKTITDLEQGVYREIQSWLDAKMHTYRKDKPSALFKIVPSKPDMAAILSKSITVSSLDEIIDIVFEWLQTELDRRLIDARESLDKDLYNSVEKKVDIVLNKSQQKPNDDSIVLITQAIKSSIQRLMTELQEWFKIPDEDRHHSLSVREVIQAVEQRFGPDINSGRLTIDRGSIDVDTRLVNPLHIRPLYDLFSELARNALKYSGLTQSRLRMKRIESNGEYFIAVSSLCARATSVNKFTSLRKAVHGHPSTSLNDALFAEGKSGLEKTAYLCAYLTRMPQNIYVIEKKGCFHVLLPIDAVGEEHSEEIVQ